LHAVLMLFRVPDDHDLMHDPRQNPIFGIDMQVQRRAEPYAAPVSPDACTSTGGGTT
jgi:hypothetical protein